MSAAMKPPTAAPSQPAAAETPAVVTSVTATGDPTGPHVVTIVQNGTADAIEVEGNVGRVIAFHKQLAEAIEMVRSVGKALGSAAAEPAADAARVHALEARVRELEEQAAARAAPLKSPAPAPASAKHEPHAAGKHR